jgi:hypothetical protein
MPATFPRVASATRFGGRAGFDDLAPSPLAPATTSPAGKRI